MMLQEILVNNVSVKIPVMWAQVTVISMQTRIKLLLVQRNNENAYNNNNYVHNIYYLLTLDHIYATRCT